jgi:hypothetical protein
MGCLLVPGHGCQHDVRLRGKMLVKRLFGNTCLARDIIHRDRLEAILAERLDGHCEYFSNYVHYLRRQNYGNVFDKNRFQCSYLFLLHEEALL